MLDNNAPLLGFEHWSGECPKKAKERGDLTKFKHEKITKINMEKFSAQEEKMSCSFATCE